MTAFFRAGVGAVVRDSEGKILTLKRKGMHDGGWQLPQGGIEQGETVLEALYREIKEEIGLSRKDFQIIDQTNDWLVYELPQEFRNSKVGWGQVQRWFLCQLAKKPDVVRPDQVEFEAQKWVDAVSLVQNAISFRQPLYRTLISQFKL